MAAGLLGPVALSGQSVSAAESGLYHTSGSLRGSLLRNRPVAVYSADPRDPWNELHHLLFTARVEARVPKEPEPGPGPRLRLRETLTEAERAEALRQHQQERFLSGWVTVRRLEGGDIPEFFFAGYPGFLLRGSRYERLSEALTREVHGPHLRGRSAEARVLFQQALWNRYDALYQGREPDAAREPRRERLVSLLGRLIARIALTRAELEGIQPNFSEVAQAYPEVDPGLFSGDTAWRELLPRSRRGEALTLFHAQTAGHRRVFRGFVRIPPERGGVACLEAGGAGQPGAVLDPSPPCFEQGGLAYGSRALLLESPLAISDRGDLVAVPLIVGVEAREIRRLMPGADGHVDLEALPFTVLHVSRRALSAGERHRGGLERLPAHELVPESVGCSPRRAGASLIPARLVCQGCHLIEGRNLMTPRRVDLGQVQVVHPRNTLQQEQVIATKTKDPGYQALGRMFPLR